MIHKIQFYIFGIRFIKEMRFLFILIGFLYSSSLFSQGSGNALVFDGTNNNVEINSTFQNQDGTKSFSFCAWVMSTNVGQGGQRILCDDQQTSGSGGYALSLGEAGSGQLRFYCRALATVSLDVPAAGYRLTNNVWYHVAATYNHTTRVRNIYVNGELAATHTHGVGEWTVGEVDNGPVTIGGESNGSAETANRFAGRIDEVSYWNKALTVTEIRDLMCKSLTGSEAQLYAYWNFNGAALGAGGVPDLTGNGYTGTMQNMVAGEIVTSAAPIGNSSVYRYTTAWAGVKLTHASPEGDSLEVSTVSVANVNNIHIYHVTSVPNTTTGINGIGGNDHYFGVFKSFYAGGAVGTYTATYFYRDNDAFQASSIADPDWLEANVRVYTRSNNSSTPWAVNATAPNTGTKTITMTAMSTEFILGYLNSTAALPIELISFSAEHRNEVVELNWTTASESNNNFFTVERSSDGINFEPIAFVNGAGNSNQVLNYSAIDPDPLNGTSYYRLKQTDFDNNYSLSEIKAVFIGTIGEVKIYPNPFTDQIIIQIANPNQVNVKLINSIGQYLEIPIRKTETSIIVETVELSTGFYTLKIVNGTMSQSFVLIK